MKRTALQRDQALVNQRLAAIDQPRAFRAVRGGLLRNVVIIGLVRLREIRRVGIGNRAFVTHPGKGSRGVEATGKGDANLLADREREEDFAHID